MKYERERRNNDCTCDEISQDFWDFLRIMKLQSVCGFFILNFRVGKLLALHFPAAIPKFSRILKFLGFSRCLVCLRIIKLRIIFENCKIKDGTRRRNNECDVLYLIFNT